MLIWNPPTNLRLYPQCFHWSEREVQGKQKGKGNVEPSSWLLAVWSAFPAQLDDVELDANFISWKLNCKTEWFVKSRNLSQFYWWLLSITSKNIATEQKFIEYCQMWPRRIYLKNINMKLKSKRYHTPPYLQNLCWSTTLWWLGFQIKRSDQRPKQTLDSKVKK